MALPNNPITRKEMYLSNIAGQETTLPDEPITREEAYLDYIAKNGGGGTGDGDMKKSVYDSDLAVSGAGGIKAFVNGQTNDLQPKTLATPITIGGESRTTVEAALGALEDNKEDTILAATPLVKEYDEVMRQEVLRLTMDDTPTANSNNPVKSSGIKSALSATVDLLKDTTGWIGGNKWKNDVRTTSVFGVTGNVNSNEQIVLTGAFTGADPNVILFGRISLKKGTYKLTGNDGSNDKIALQVYKAGVLNVYDYGNGGEFTLNADTSDILLRIYLNVGATISDSLTMSPMILTSEEYAISPAYRPCHESVEEMLFYKAGDVVELNGLGFAGFVTNGSTELHVAITLSKIVKATNISLAGQLTVRGLNGYVLQSKQISELTVSVEKIAENVVMIILKNTDSSAFNVTNNTPLFFTFELQTAKLTFTA